VAGTFTDGQLRDVVASSLFVAGSVYTRRPDGDLCFNGERPGPRWHGHGYFPRRLWMLEEGRNPKTGTPVQVAPKRLPFFKIGKDLHERLNKDRLPKLATAAPVGSDSLGILWQRRCSWMRRYGDDGDLSLVRPVAQEHPIGSRCPVLDIGFKDLLAR
jgi:hypothetical protein